MQFVYDIIAGNGCHSEKETLKKLSPRLKQLYLLAFLKVSTLIKLGQVVFRGNRKPDLAIITIKGPSKRPLRELKTSMGITIIFNLSF